MHQAEAVLAATHTHKALIRLLVGRASIGFLQLGPTPAVKQKRKQAFMMGQSLDIWRVVGKELGFTEPWF